MLCDNNQIMPISLVEDSQPLSVLLIMSLSADICVVESAYDGIENQEPVQMLRYAEISFSPPAPKDEWSIMQNSWRCNYSMLTLDFG